MITKKEFSQAIQDNASVVAGAVPAASYDSSGVMTTEMYKYAAKNYNNGTGEGILIYLGNFSTAYRRGYYFIAGYISDYPLLAYIHYSIRVQFLEIWKFLTIG